MTQDPNQLHRAALAPLLPGATAATLDKAISSAIEIGEQQFTQFLLQQGLAPMWDERLLSHQGSSTLSATQRDIIHQSRMHATGHYLIQRHQLQQVKNSLDAADLPHVAIKGSHTREVYYATPALRPAEDIDIVLHPRDKVAAIKTLKAHGFEFSAEPKNISHECSLSKGNTTIDLHWDILRPGRARQPMVETLLAGRVDYGSHWGINPSADLFLMLVHPVFAKYSTTPQASLSRLVDLAQLLQQNLADTIETKRLLTTAGLETAGWITATWFLMLTGSDLCSDIADELKPSRLKRRYLQNWLRSNRASRLLNTPILVQLGFTLPAHDTTSDAIRAMWRAEQCKREGQRTLAGIIREVEQPVTTNTVTQGAQAHSASP